MVLTIVNRFSYFLPRQIMGKVEGKVGRIDGGGDSMAELSI